MDVSAVRRQGVKRSLLMLAALACAALMLLHWAVLSRLESTGDVYACRKPYPPYLYINDFTQFYAVGRLAASSERALIYDPKTQDRYLNEVISPKHTVKICFGQNVPWFFMIMVPFAALPLREAYLLFCGLGIAFGATGLIILLRKVRHLDWVTTAAMLFACYAAMPAWFALNHGNTSYYLLGFGCLYAYGLLKGKDGLAGVALALLAQKPQYAIPAALPAFRYKRWQLIAVAAVVELSLWLAAAVYLGPSNVLGYPRTLFSTDTNSNLDGMYPQQMVCVRAMFASYVSQHASMPLACLTFAIGLGALFFMWVKVKEKDAVQNRWALAVTFMAMLVVSPHTSLYDILLLALPAVLTVPLPDVRASRFTAPAVWLLLMVTYPLVSWVLYLSENPMQFFQHQTISWFNALLLAVLCLSYFQLFGRRRTVPAEGAAQAD